jgi:RNA polymerase sigma-70 factor (ECF subfamily)
MKPIGHVATYTGQVTNPSHDADLVARMQAGDEQALALLYDRHELAVRTQVRRVLDGSMDVEDVVEEVFWQAWRNAHRFDAVRGDVGAWLRTMARSRALDRQRAMMRAGEVELGDDDGHGGLEAGEPSAEATLMAEERAVRVQKALRELPEEQRRVLELAYYEGLSQTEVAQRTETPLGTVKTRMRLALQKLRASLGSLGGVDT